jgi:hypothetical protein
LRDINKANWDLAHRLLRCLTVAVRPLRVAELVEVLAVDFGTSRGATSNLNTDWRWEDEEEAVLSTCSSLISVVDEYGRQVVQSSHFSVKEFLTSSRIAGSSADVSRFHILLKPPHMILAKACQGVLVRLGELDLWMRTTSRTTSRKASRTESRTISLSLGMLLNIGSTMVDLRMSRPTYEKGRKISLTPINHIMYSVLRYCNLTTVANSLLSKRSHAFLASINQFMQKLDRTILLLHDHRKVNCLHASKYQFLE